VLLDVGQPGDTPVYQAYREADGTLIVELDGRGHAVTLTLRNAGASPVFQLPEPVTGAWDAGGNTLVLSPCGRIRFTVVPGRDR